MTTPSDDRPKGSNAPIEQRLERALADTATATLPDTAHRPDFATVAARAGGARQRPLRSYAPILAAAAAVLVVALVVALTGTGSGHGRTPPAATPSTGRQHSFVPLVRPNPGFDPPGVGFCDNFSTGCTQLNFEPLYPFHSYVQARRWYVAHRAETSDRHFNAEQTADRYLHDVLGLTGLVSGGFGDLSGHGRFDLIVLSVGYRAHGRFHHVGGIELGRYSDDHRGPWEVLGSPLSAGFAITDPRGGARLDEGGYPVTGRDAPLGARVQVRVLGGATATSGRVGSSRHWTVQVIPTLAHVTTLIATSGGTARRPAHVFIRGVHR